MLPLPFSLSTFLLFPPFSFFYQQFPSSPPHPPLPYLPSPHSFFLTKKNSFLPHLFLPVLSSLIHTTTFPSSSLLPFLRPYPTYIASSSTFPPPLSFHRCHPFISFPPLRGIFLPTFSSAHDRSSVSPFLLIGVPPSPPPLPFPMLTQPMTCLLLSPENHHLCLPDTAPSLSPS